MRQKLRGIWSKYKAVIAGIGIVLAVYLTLTLLGITTCPMKALFGLSCPGCGMSRACLSALKLDLASAFEYHPLWILLPFSVFFSVFFKVKNKNAAFFATVTLSLAALIAVYFYRLFFTDSDIVSFSYRSSLIYRAVKAFFTPS